MCVCVCVCVCVRACTCSGESMSQSGHSYNAAPPYFPTVPPTIDPQSNYSPNLSHPQAGPPLEGSAGVWVCGCVCVCVFIGGQVLSEVLVF